MKPRPLQNDLRAPGKNSQPAYRFENPPPGRQVTFSDTGQVLHLEPSMSSIMSNLLKVTLTAQPQANAADATHGSPSTIESRGRTY